MGWLRARFGAERRAAETLPVPPADTAFPVESTEPDEPQSFGFKINWLAVRTEDGRAVADALALTSVKQANWRAGLAGAAGVRRAGGPVLVFVAPPIDGWTLVIGGALPYPNDVGGSAAATRIGRQFRQTLLALAGRFDDVQFFGSHRVMDFAAWAKAKDGAVLRVFSWVGADGVVLANEGPQTVEERRLRLLDLSGRDPLAAADHIFERLEDEDEKAAPDEEDVLRLAGHWSLDPSVLEERGLPTGLGLVGQLPN